MKTEILDPRLADVGGIPIARLLPNKGKQPIGAWCFMDHAGPAEFGDDEEGMQVGRHPHINLQTFSWMIDGEVLHKDSIGNEKVITKNQVNVMTAGTGNDQGISHTEQSVFPDTGGSAEAWRGMNMVQLWIALPLDQKIERNFHHYPELPSWKEQGAEYVLTTGDYTTPKGESYSAPTIQYSKLIGLDVHLVEDTEVSLVLEPGFEYGILMVVDGIEYQGKKYEQQRCVKSAEHNSVCGWKSSEGYPSRRYQPDLVTVPDRAKSIIDHSPVGIIFRYEWHQCAQTQIKTVKHEIDGPD